MQQCSEDVHKQNGKTFCAFSIVSGARSKKEVCQLYLWNKNFSLL
jgi:hypothetical protein